MCEQALLPGGMAAAPRDVQDFCSELCWDHEILIWRMESDLEALRPLHGGSPPNLDSAGENSAQVKGAR